MKPTQALIKSLFDYDPEVGIFYWKVPPTRRIKTGRIAGTLNQNYVMIGINRKQYRAHHLAWLWVYGVFPVLCLDHINRVTSDNRISNLREATPHQNSTNSTPYASKKGIAWVKKTKNWRAHSFFSGHRIELGVYKSFEEAEAVLNKFLADHPNDFFAGDNKPPPGELNPLSVKDGIISLRVPRALYTEIKEAAKLKGVSINKHALSLIAPAPAPAPAKVRTTEQVAPQPTRLFSTRLPEDLILRLKQEALSNQESVQELVTRTVTQYLTLTGSPQ